MKIMNKKPLAGRITSTAKSRATLRRGLVLACSLLPAVSWAQPQPQTQQPEQIIVTGTRLPDPNRGSTSPIQVVNAQEIAISGRNDVVDLLQLMPQAFANDLGQDLGNRTSGLTTAGGVATADLRGLGPNRTLVLVNGRRLGPGSPFTAIQQPAPDLDQIPSRLIERVEVVTGGASAVYGSDAMAGVVNFIMKKDFEGVEFDVTSGFNYHDNNSALPQSLAADAGFRVPSGTVTDGHTQSYSLIAGTNSGDNRGNFTVFLGYQTQDGVRSDQRDYGAGQLFTDTATVNGVKNVPTGQVFMSGSTNANWFEPKSGPNANKAVYSVSGNGFVDWNTVDTTPPAHFDSQKDIYMTRQYNRYNAGLIGHYDLNDYVQPYVEFSMMNDKTHQQIAPSALFKQSNPLTPDNFYRINCSNPLLSTDERGKLCTPQQILDDTAAPGTVLADVNIGRRNIEGGGRTSDYEHTNYRGVAGLRGEIGPAWHYDGYGQYYYVQFYNSNDQYLNFAKITDALLVTGTSANPVCISGPPCVPYNLFRDGGVTQDQLAPLYTSGTGYGTNMLKTVHADFTGDLGEYGVKLPGARQGLSLNVGYETREEQQKFKPDDAEQSGLLSGYGGAQVAIDRSVTVDEYFAEVRVPLLQDKKAAADLSIDAGWRTSDYSTSGSVDTSKFEIQYAPVTSYRLRASYNKAIRAPSIVELFNPQNVGKITIIPDPCAATRDPSNNVVPATESLQHCLRTVSPAQAAAFTAAYGNGGTTNTIPQGTANQLSQLQGGNPNLKPETANSYSIGLSLSPERVQRFTASVDYWDVKIDAEVAPLPAFVALTNCPATGNPQYCAALLRQPQTFTLDGASVAGGGYIIQTNLNIGGAETSGIDVQGTYRLDFDRSGSLNFALAGSYMLAQKTTPYVDAHTYDCTGLFGSTCQTVNPVWRHLARATWATPKYWSATLSWRYIAGVKEDNNDADPTLHNSKFGGYDSFNASIGAQNYFDLAATYRIKKIEVRAGINNITDKAPPFLGSEIVGGGSPNTYSTYDMFGRQVFIALNVRL